MRDSGRPEQTVAGTAPLNIAIGSGPVGSIAAGVRKDLALVKAALLYADRVTLRSPITTMLVAVAALRSLTLDEKVGLIVHLAPVLDQETGEKLAHDLQGAFATANRQRRRQLEGRIRSAFDSIKARATEMLNDFGANDLIRATQLDALDIQSFNMGVGGGVISSIRQAAGAPNYHDPDVTHQFIDGVLADIRNPNTFPMLDAHTKRIINAGVREGVFQFTDAEVKKGQHVALAGHVFDRLPVFERASVDELVDVRMQLQVPLVRFRSAMIRFSVAVKEAPWDDDFRTEAELILLQEVEPALIELDELVRENSYLWQLLNAVIGDRKALVGALGLAMTNWGQLAGELLSVPASAVAGMLATHRAWKAEANRRKLDKQIRSHEMYFVYHLHTLED